MKTIVLMFVIFSGFIASAEAVASKYVFSMDGVAITVYENMGSMCLTGRKPGDEIHGGHASMRDENSGELTRGCWRQNVSTDSVDIYWDVAPKGFWQTYPSILFKKVQ